MRRQRFDLPTLFFVVLCFAPFVLAQTDDAPTSDAPAPGGQTSRVRNPDVHARTSDVQKSDAQTGPSLAPVSHARVVSLSLVEGAVFERGPGSDKWARATLETPIQEGVSIATAKHSFVEVQFENGSTVRLGELSRIDFKELALAPHSGRVDHLRLDVGFATIHVTPSRHDECVLSAYGASLAPRGKTEFRTDLSHGYLRVEVFKGRVQVGDSSQAERLRKDQVLAYDSRSGGDFQVTDSIQMDDWDKWALARDQQAERAAYNNQGAGWPLYGWDELIPFGNMGAFPYGDSGDGF